MRAYRTAAAVLLTTTLAAGCSSGSDTPSSPSTPSPSPSAPAVESPSPTPTIETPEPEPTGVSLSVDCDTAIYDTYKLAWPDKQESCDATALGAMSDREEQALQTAYGDEGDLGSLGTLYGLCAQSGPEAWGGLTDDASVKETKGMLALCPDHPDRKLLKQLMSAAEADIKLEAEGRIFWDGVYRVGKEIKPGTYYVMDVDGCYWERTDRNGNIIDNNFINAAKRVQATIRSSDYSFTAEGCGKWRPVSQ